MSKTPHGFTYPYLPEGHTHGYVGMDNSWMHMAYEYAKEHSIDKAMPTASIIVKDGRIVGKGANGNNYHDEHVCERVKQSIPTGEGYELCEGCHPKNHSEPRAIQNALEQGNDTKGADVYLWGHWWCCESCWKHMIEAGVNRVFLLNDSDILFNKEADGNIVGRQFDEK